MFYTTEKANEFIRENKENTEKKFYPEYHFAPPIGWTNDPNGVVIFNNELHLFYQHYPYEAVHGAMHWGHAKSEDGLHWQDLPVALAPDQEYDKGGVFSGSAIEKDGKLYVMYTGHLPDETDETKTRQNQNIAISEDGMTFKKYEGNPVLTENDIPAGTSVVDFRDPKIFEKDGIYYSVIGSKTLDNKGQVILYQSKDLLNWKYVSIIFPYNPYLGTMVECPDLLLFKDKAVFILSAMDYVDEKGKVHSHISWLIEGEMDWENFEFQQRSIKEMDKGMDFYAPQTVKLAEERYLAIAWMQNWQANRPTYELGHNWFGQMTLPRLITVENGQIQQSIPLKILDLIKIKEKKLENGKISIEDTNYIAFKIAASNVAPFDLFFTNEEGEFLQFSYSLEKKGLFFSRKNTTCRISGEDGSSMEESNVVTIDEKEALSVQIFLDRSSIEIFINENESITSTFYIQRPFSLSNVKTQTEHLFEVLELGNIG